MTRRPPRAAMNTRLTSKVSSTPLIPFPLVSHHGRFAHLPHHLGIESNVLIAYSGFSPYKLSTTAATVKDLQADAAKGIIYNFCGTGAIYIPPPLEPYVELLPEANDPLVNTLAAALFDASPAFGLCEMLPENNTKAMETKFVMAGVDVNSASVQGAAFFFRTRFAQLLGDGNIGTSFNNIGSSRPDEMLAYKGKVVGTLEYKASTNSVIEGLPQAFKAAIARCEELYQQNVPLEDIVVPFISYTAGEELHGAVHVLEGGIASCAVLARCALDTEVGCVEAARWRLAMVENGKRLAALEALTTGTRDNEPKLYTRNYFVKRMPWNYAERPPSQGAEPTVYHASLRQLMLFEKLRKGGVPAALPLSRLTTGTGWLMREEDGTKSLPPVAFVFENLAAQGFWSGVPMEKDLFLPWLLGAINAIRLAHAAGVVHLDTHMHNFMWREHSNGSVVMTSPPGAKHQEGWPKAHPGISHLNALRSASQGRQEVDVEEVGQRRSERLQAGREKKLAAISERTWRRAGDVAAQVRRNYWGNTAAWKESRQVDVVLVDWDHSMELHRPARPTDIDPHRHRTGWIESLAQLTEGKPPPTAPDWDILRAVLVMWAQHGSECPAFRPLSRRMVKEEDWRMLINAHKAVRGMQEGQLGEDNGLQTTLEALLALDDDHGLDKGRLAELLAQVKALYSHDD